MTGLVSGAADDLALGNVALALGGLMALLLVAMAAPSIGVDIRSRSRSSVISCTDASYGEEINS